MRSGGGGVAGTVGVDHARGDRPVPEAPGKSFMRAFVCVSLAALSLGLAAPAFAQTEGGAALTCPARADAARDGWRDFDWEHGEWTTHLLRLDAPLSGSTRWVEYRGVTRVAPALAGRANLVELSVEGETGRIEGLSLRLYNPEARQWSLHFANIRSGELTIPTVGAFAGDCGEFYSQDTFGGRAVLVRFVIQRLTPDTARFEQAFSADGGRTWEVNWIAVDTRR